MTNDGGCHQLLVNGSGFSNQHGGRNEAAMGVSYVQFIGKMSSTIYARIVSMLKLYRQIIRRYPISAQAIQTGFLMGAGDTIAQKFVERKSLNDYDFRRTWQYFTIGTFFVGPSLRVWYGILHNSIGAKSKTAAVKKVAVDQILFAPIFMAVFLGIICLSQGYTIHEAKEKILHDYPDVIQSNYKVWPAIQLCNFYFVPLQFQVLVVQIVAIFWNTYISWKIGGLKKWEP